MDYMKIFLISLAVFSISTVKSDGPATEPAECEMPNHAGSLVCNCMNNKQELAGTQDIEDALSNITNSLKNQRGKIEQIKVAMDDQEVKFARMEATLQNLVELVSNLNITVPDLRPTTVQPPVQDCSLSGFYPLRDGAGGMSLCLKTVQDVGTKTHPEATAYCQSLGHRTRLIAVDDHDKYTYLTDYLLANFQGKHWWIGATRTGNTWTWLSGKVLTIRQDEWWPGYTGLSQYCLAIQVSSADQKGFWDTNCVSKRSFICEKY